MPAWTASASRLAAPWLLMALAVWIGVSGVLPPDPEAADASLDEFSAARAFIHVQAIARQDRPLGSPGNTAARDYLVAELEALGAIVDLQHFTVPDYFGEGARRIAAANIVGLIPGTDPTGSIVLMSHYDTYPDAPGANDAATGVATVVEAGRALLAGPSLRNDVILLLTDGEEPAPRYGATAFVGHHLLADGVGLVLNFEAVGGAGPSVLIESSGDEGALLGAYVAADPLPVAHSYFTGLVDLLGGSDTDFAPFREAGVPGFHFAYVHGSPIYHTPGDDPGSVRLSSLQHHGSHALALTRHFGDLDLDGYRGRGDEVFFSLVGRFVVRYPARWGITLVALGGLLLGWILVAGRRRSRLSLRRVAAGAGGLLGGALVVGLVTDGAWRLVLAVFWRDSGPSVAAALVLLALLLGMAAGLTYLGYRRMERRLGTLEVETGSIVAWWLNALLASLLLPGAGYLFAWPALAAALATGRHLQRRSAVAGWWERQGALALVALPTVVLCLPALDTLHQLAQPRPGNPDSQFLDLAAAVGLMAALAAGLLIPHLRRALAPAPSPAPAGEGGGWGPPHHPAPAGEGGGWGPPQPAAS